MTVLVKAMANIGSYAAIIEIVPVSAMVVTLWRYGPYQPRYPCRNEPLRVGKRPAFDSLDASRPFIMKPMTLRR